MAEGRMGLPVVRGFGETGRRDLWWVQPTAVFLGFATFIVYSTWAAFQNDHYTYGSYLSPFYSPALFADPPQSGFSDGRKLRAEEHLEHSFFKARPGWLPTWLILSPALLILPFPGLFRFTCYYYRGAYYKAWWADPPNCAVGELRKSYWGENSLPLIMQNVHRYFLYIALVFILLLSWDVIQACRFKDAQGAWHFGVGVGTLVLLLNVILLGSYTLGCHSLRHLIGGRIDQLSSAPTQQRAYDCVSCLNRRHMLFAWCSLVWVGFSDVYVRMCSMGYWHDLHWTIG
jgi:hypothetical protein